MPVSQLDDIFNPGVDVLGTTQDQNGTILAQTGDVVGETVDSDNVEVWQQPGFASRPAKAQSGKAACQAITLTQGSNDIAVAMRDLRVQVPALQEGETCLFAVGSDLSVKAKIILGQDGTITIVGSKVVVQADEVDLAGASDFAALANKVDTNLSNLSAAVSAATCPGGTGGPLVFVPPSLPSVAGTGVKVS